MRSLGKRKEPGVISGVIRFIWEAQFREGFCGRERGPASGESAFGGRKKGTKVNLLKLAGRGKSVEGEGGGEGAPQVRLPLGYLRISLPLGKGGRG